MTNTVLPTPNTATNCNTALGACDQATPLRETNIFGSPGAAHAALTHLRSAAVEIQYLRRRNEVLEAQMSVVATFDAVAGGGAESFGSLQQSGANSAYIDELEDFLERVDDRNEERQREKDLRPLRAAYDDLNRLAEWLRAFSGQLIVSEGKAVDVAISVMEPRVPIVADVAMQALAALELAQRAAHWHGWHDAGQFADRDSLEAKTSDAVDAALGRYRRYVTEDAPRPAEGSEQEWLDGLAGRAPEPAKVDTGDEPAI